MNNEPKKIVAGFSYSWTKTLTDYPAASHTLKYTITRTDGNARPLTVTATPAGLATYEVALTPAQTGKLEGGTYYLSGYVEDDETGGTALRVPVYGLTLMVLPDPTKSAGDTRTFARRMADNLKDTLERLARGTITTATVNGKSYTRVDMAAIRSELSRWEEIAAREDGISGRHIKARFRAVGA